MLRNKEIQFIKNHYFIQLYNVDIISVEKTHLLEKLTKSLNVNPPYGTSNKLRFLEIIF